MLIYGDTQSGNCYKIQLLLSHLQTQSKPLKVEWVAMDIVNGDTKNAEFLQRTPIGKIPLLELDDGRCLSESNAILNYLAAGSALIPQDNWLKAKVLQWQFFEQYSHEPYIAVARFINLYLGLPDDKKEEYESKQAGGHKALKVMEEQLKQSDFLVSNQLSVADISLYAYTHVAHEGGFDISQYPFIQQWLKRVSALPQHLPMQTN